MLGLKSDWGSLPIQTAFPGETLSAVRSGIVANQFGLVPKEKEMKTTSFEQVKALLKEYPLIRDAHNRFKLPYPCSIEARSLKLNDCFEKTAIYWNCSRFYANFRLFFFDENNLFLGQMETKKKFSLKHFFFSFGFDSFRFAECTQENMLEALERIKPARFPRYALMMRGPWYHEFLLLKIPKGFNSLQEFIQSEEAKEPERNRLKIEQNHQKAEQAEREVKEALEKEFGE
jgi:hypothetical protein